MAKMLAVCKIYDDKIPLAALEKTFKVVEAVEGFTERQLYKWLVLLFSEADADAVLVGVEDLWEARQSALYSSHVSMVVFCSCLCHLANNV